MTTMDFSKETVQKSVEVIKKHNDDFYAICKEFPDLSIEEAVQKMIMMKYDDAEIEAEEIVNDIKNGLANFDTMFNKNKATETINVKECLEDATKNNTEEERKNCYVNILTAIELLNEKGLTEDEVKERLAKNAELSVDEILVKIEAAMNSAIILDVFAQKVKDGLNSEVLSQLAQEIEANKSEYRFMAAVWLYMEQRDGNLKLSDSDIAISAEHIGTLAGAAVEAIVANNALSEGKMDIATWQKVMKWILGAVIGLALAYGAILFVANVSMLVLGLVWAIFGTGTVAMLSSVILSVYVAWKLSKFMGDASWMVIQAYSDFYNSHIAGITAKVTSWIATVKSWFVKKSEVSEKKEENDQSGNQQTEVIDNNEAQNYQGLIDMA